MTLNHKRNTMKQILSFLLICSSFFSCSKNNASQELKVLQFNIWQEGTVVPGGYEAIISQIIQSDADFVTLSEVRNYNNTRFCDRIIESLKDSGYTYYSFYSYDSGLISRYPIIDSTVVFPPQNDEGSAYRALIDMNGQEVALYTCHLDYRHCTYYDIYGYSGVTWEKREPLLDLDSILTDNRLSKRDDAMAAIIKMAEEDRAKNRLVFIGGDYNEPSHLDWTEETKDLYSHQGLVIPWTVSSMLEKANYIDAYRELYPSAVTHPGFTFPSANSYVDLSQLLWAEESDERERVDFIHYTPNSQLKLQEVIIWGPQESIHTSQIVIEKSLDTFRKAPGIWPTDHKGVLATFIYTQK